MTVLGRALYRRVPCTRESLVQESHLYRRDPSTGETFVQGGPLYRGSLVQESPLYRGVPCTGEFFVCVNPLFRIVSCTGGVHCIGESVVSTQTEIHRTLSKPLYADFDAVCAISALQQTLTAFRRPHFVRRSGNLARRVDSTAFELRNILL